MARTGLQTGNQVLRFANKVARDDILPRIVRGECFFGIGMSEPGSGSDLAAVRTRATRVDGGWSISGTKLWTTNGHQVHYLIVLARTSPAPKDDRRAGLSQFIVDMTQAGIQVRPVYTLAGRHEFNEILFENVFVPDTHIMGKEGQGWSLVTGELGYERSGPDRFLSNAQLLFETAKQIGRNNLTGEHAALSRQIAHLYSLRRVSLSVAGMLQRGAAPTAEAALVKDVGTKFEQENPELAVALRPPRPVLQKMTGSMICCAMRSWRRLVTRCEVTQRKFYVASLPVNWGYDEHGKSDITGQCRTLFQRNS